MNQSGEFLTEQFHRWETRGRGWKVFDHPVSLEPPFQSFEGYSVTPNRPLDDARRHTHASAFMDRLRRAVRPSPPPVEAPTSEPQPSVREPQEWLELPLFLPLSRSVPTPQGAQFLRHVCRIGEPLALEILGTERETVPQFVASPRTATRVKSAIESCFPSVVCVPAPASDATPGTVASAWCDSDSCFAVVELGLAREVMLPLGNPHCDLVAGVVAAMDAFEKGELGLLQILFEPAREPWIDSMARSVTRMDGKPMFDNRADLVEGLRQKSASPLFAVVIRLVSSAANFDRAWELTADLAAPLSALAQSGGNYLLPLNNQGYPGSDHESDILDRASRRSGMLLSMEELLPLILPPVTATSRKLRRETRSTRVAPNRLLNHGSLLLGINRHAGMTREVWLTAEHRVRHMHVIGASGTGKSTFLLNLIRQDLECGEGFAVIDPHGDLIDTVLGLIPSQRTKDVVVIDPSDEEFSVGLNILAAHSDLERNLLASDLTSVFRRLSTSWGDQMESVLRNAILAFLESSRGGTLADLRRFLLDAAFRREFLSTIVDPEIVFYWTKAFPQLTGGKSIGPLITRLDEFLSRKPIRFMVAQKENRLDFGALLDRGGILLAKLPQGLIGRENTALLGSLITAKLQMAAMSRQRMPSAQRRDFWCYMDEFQHFITPSMAEILAGARKYRLGLILAHQELRHLDADRDVASAVHSNCLARVVFKVGDADARFLEGGFSHFEARDLMNLGVGEAVCRVERSDDDFNLSIPFPDTVSEELAHPVREEVVAASRAKYARSRSEIEMELLQKWQDEQPAKTSAEVATQPPTTPSPNLPKVSEAQEAKPAVPTVPKPSEISPSSEEQIAVPIVPRKPMELGRGGAEHKAIQLRLKEAGERLGYRAILEKPVLDGQGSIDVALEKPDGAIACEINVASTIDYEIGNVAKCLKAGYAFVAVICPKAERLKRLVDAIGGSLEQSVSERVKFFTPDQFIDCLEQLAAQPGPPRVDPPPLEEKRRGYKVKRAFVEMTSKESKEREELALKIIAEKLRSHR